MIRFLIILFALPAFAFQTFAAIYYSIDYKFLRIKDPLFFIVLFVPIILLLFSYYLKKVKFIITILFYITFLISCIFLYYNALTIIYISPFQSQTKNIKNYLVLDKKNDNVNLLFLKEIPVHTISKPKYYYHYEFDVDGCGFRMDIIAEWVLNDKDYETEKLRVKELYPAINFEKIGYYHCIKIIDEIDEDEYEYLIFAYNDSNNSLRYIYSVNECIGSLENTPYFIKLNWN